MKPVEILVYWIASVRTAGSVTPKAWLVTDSVTVLRGKRLRVIPVRAE